MAEGPLGIFALEVQRSNSSVTSAGGSAQKFSLQQEAASKPGSAVSRHRLDEVKVLDVAEQLPLVDGFKQVGVA